MNTAGLQVGNIPLVSLLGNNSWNFLLKKPWVPFFVKVPVDCQQSQTMSEVEYGTELKEHRRWRLTFFWVKQQERKTEPFLRQIKSSRMAQWAIQFRRPEFNAYRRFSYSYDMLHTSQSDCWEYPVLRLSGGGHPSTQDWGFLYNAPYGHRQSFRIRIDRLHDEKVDPSLIEKWTFLASSYR